MKIARGQTVFTKEKRHMKGKLVGILLLVALTASVLTGCDEKPMTIEEAEDFYQQNETDIQTVIHYLQALDCESVGIYIGEVFTRETIS